MCPWIPDVPNRVLNYSKVKLPHPVWSAGHVLYFSDGMGAGNLAPSESGKRTGTESVKGPWAGKQYLLFHPALIHVSGQKPEANSDSWQGKAWTTVGRTYTALLFQWWCDRFGQIIPTPSIQWTLTRFCELTGEDSWRQWGRENHLWIGNDGFPA